MKNPEAEGVKCAKHEVIFVFTIRQHPAKGARSGALSGDCKIQLNLH
jgi:hypothetical protein